MEDNVGIGVLNPEYRLDVNGRMRIRSGERLLRPQEFGTIIQQMM